MFGVSLALLTRFSQLKPFKIGQQNKMANQQRGLKQNMDALLKFYASRLRDDVRSMLENFHEIIRLGKCDQHPQFSRITQSEQDDYEMHVRAANMVRAGESLMRLIAELKQNLILNDFPAINEAIDTDSKHCKTQADEMDLKLCAVRDEMEADLLDLEEEYYMSDYKKVRDYLDEETFKKNSASSSSVSNS